MVVCDEWSKDLRQPEQVGVNMVDARPAGDSNPAPGPKTGGGNL